MIPDHRLGTNIASRYEVCGLASRYEVCGISSRYEVCGFGTIPVLTARFDK